MQQGAEDTAIIFTSDHGEMMGDGNMLYKGTMLESAIRVPFVYKPIKGDRKEIGFTHSKPIGLTKLLKKRFRCTEDPTVWNEFAGV